MHTYALTHILSSSHLLTFKTYTGVSRERPWERKTMLASARGRPWKPVSEKKTMGANEREEDHGSKWERGRPWEPRSERKTMGAKEREKDHGGQRERKIMSTSERSIIIYMLSYIHYMYILYIYISCTYVIYLLHVHMSSYNYYVFAK